jgi:hypothetical protein
LSANRQSRDAHESHDQTQHQIAAFQLLHSQIL